MTSHAVAPSVQGSLDLAVDCLRQILRRQPTREEKRWVRQRILPHLSPLVPADALPHVLRALVRLLLFDPPSNEKLPHFSDWCVASPSSVTAARQFTRSPSLGHDCSGDDYRQGSGSFSITRGPQASLLCGFLRHGRAAVSLVSLCDASTSVACGFSRSAREETNLAAVVDSPVLVLASNWAFVPRCPRARGASSGIFEISGPVLFVDLRDPPVVRRFLGSRDARQALTDITISQFPAVISTRRVLGQKIRASSRFHTRGTLIGVLPPEPSTDDDLFTFLFRDKDSVHATVPVYAKGSVGTALAVSLVLGATYDLYSLSIVQGTPSSHLQAGFLVEEHSFVQFASPPPPSSHSLRQNLATVEGHLVSDVKKLRFHIKLVHGRTVLVLLHHCREKVPHGLRMGARVHIKNGHVLRDPLDSQIRAIGLCSHSELELVEFSPFPCSSAPFPSRRLIKLPHLGLAHLYCVSATWNKLKRDYGALVRSLEQQKGWVESTLLPFIMKNTGTSQKLESMPSVATNRLSSFFRHEAYCALGYFAPPACVVSVTDILQHHVVLRAQSELQDLSSGKSGYRVLSSADLFPPHFSCLGYLSLPSRESTRYLQIASDSVSVRDSYSDIGALIADFEPVFLDQFCLLKEFDIVIERIPNNHSDGEPWVVRSYLILRVSSICPESVAVSTALPPQSRMQTGTIESNQANIVSVRTMLQNRHDGEAVIALKGLVVSHHWSGSIDRGEKPFLKVEIRAEDTPDKIDLFLHETDYLKLGLFPGAFLHIYDCSVSFSANGRSYLRATQSTKIRVEKWAAQRLCRVRPTAFSRLLVDFYELHRSDKRSWFITARINKVVSVELDIASVSAMSSSLSSIQTRVVVEVDDGSTEALATLERFEHLATLVHMPLHDISYFGRALQRFGKVIIRREGVIYVDRGIFTSEPYLVQLQQLLYEAEGTKHGMWAKPFWLPATDRLHLDVIWIESSHINYSMANESTQD